MIFQQAFHRALDNVSDSDVERFGCLAKHVAIVVSHRTNEAYRQLLVAFIVLDVAHKERLERIEHQAVYCRLLDVLNQERRQRSEEAVGCRLFIHFLDDCHTVEVVLLEEFLAQCLRQLVFKHIAYKQLAKHGLKKSQLRITDDAIRRVIAAYTKESGVRVLERQLGKLCRKAAMQLVEGDVKRVDITENNLKELLGTQQYSESIHSDRDQVGVVNGLAWTQVGGEILEVEAQALDGSGKLELTGNLGSVMQESAKAALTCLRSRWEELGLPRDFYKTKDVHVHFPEGAVPKDGPSAGIAITTAMLSALTGRPVRGSVAMTGEVTLRGRVLPIGGLKEKTMAALRNGVHTVLIPRENVKDLDEIDQTVRAGLHFIPVDTVDQVFEAALVPPRGEHAAPRGRVSAESPAALSV